MLPWECGDEDDDRTCRREGDVYCCLGETARRLEREGDRVRGGMDGTDDTDSNTGSPAKLAAMPMTPRDFNSASVSECGLP